MILTVTLNAALDVTYQLDRIQRRGSNRVRTAAQRAGGKGVNVSRVLDALGRPTVITGLAGGRNGLTVRADLAAAGLREQLLTIEQESRRTVAVVEEAEGDTTIFLEPGPVVSATEWRGFLDLYRELAPTASAVVLSGSLPLGVPRDAYGVLIGLARIHGVPVVLDADGAALSDSLAAGPALVKPNAAELERATGTGDPLAGALALRAAGARSVVASLGPAGLLACTPEGSWQARPPERIAGNPTGAGDAAVAALTAGLVAGTPWPERLRRAVALSAAAVLSPLAGGFDAAAYRRLLPLVSVRAVHEGI
ncbi:1-phosphofructokinase family hexose kinase [Streptacidiphilus sp. N1-3]|uniref:1-phosphofructokinase family hexose kinase n=1 Tax=Streptacidiphilus alkalitolerans TaxID=3342712 RepID=A0ABV6XB92_9ACTN